jgi:hypothetical protein
LRKDLCDLFNRLIDEESNIDLHTASGRVI